MWIATVNCFMQWCNEFPAHIISHALPCWCHSDVKGIITDLLVHNITDSSDHLPPHKRRVKCNKNYCNSCILIKGSFIWINKRYAHSINLSRIVYWIEQTCITVLISLVSVMNAFNRICWLIPMISNIQASEWRCISLLSISNTRSANFMVSSTLL